MKVYDMRGVFLDNDKMEYNYIELFGDDQHKEISERTNEIIEDSQKQRDISFHDTTASVQQIKKGYESRGYKFNPELKW